MKKSEIDTLFGKILYIRDHQHILIGARDDAMLLLEFNSKEQPYQYVVAHHPSFHKGELVWTQGSYYPFYHPRYDIGSMTACLQGAAMELHNKPFYAAMADDDLPPRCIGIFSDKSLAENAAEKVMNRSDEAVTLCHELNKPQLTLSEYSALRDDRLLEKTYWIEEHSPNKADE